jgi:CRISPR-associated DxTHG motif protein
MAIITILGLIPKAKSPNMRAKYSFDDKLTFSLKKERYTNMLPLLIDNFDQKIIPLYTEDAKKTQQEVLEDEFGNRYEEIFSKEYLIEEVDEEGYSKTFRLINNAIKEEEENIIDLSHGFRHLPILATISLIVNNIENTQQIKHIFFAKEIEKNREYEIIDLKNYLELANISYMLSTFNQNYTVSGNIQFTNPLYQKLANELKNFSEHFLSNSLKAIIEEDMIDNILENLDKLQKEEDIQNLNNFIKYIRLHLIKIKGLRAKEHEYLKLYELSKIMDERGYQLNAITLLFEAIGYYCYEKIYQNVPAIKEHIDTFKTFIEEKKHPANVYSHYTLTNQFRNIIKLGKRFSGDFLFNPQTINWNKQKLKSTPYRDIPKEKTTFIKNEIFNYIDTIPKTELKKFKNYIRNMEALRNNLAHGNSSEPVNNIETLFEKYTKTFEELISQKDILGLPKRV